MVEVEAAIVSHVSSRWRFEQAALNLFNLALSMKLLHPQEILEWSRVRTRRQFEETNEKWKDKKYGQA